MRTQPTLEITTKLKRSLELRETENISQIRVKNKNSVKMPQKEIDEKPNN